MFCLDSHFETGIYLINKLINQCLLLLLLLFALVCVCIVLPTLFLTQGKKSETNTDIVQS